MSPETVWKNFTDTGRIEYYLEYKNLLNKRENNNAGNDRCAGVAGK